MSSLILTSETLAGSPSVGQIEYNGQFHGTDSNSARAQMQRITLGTVNAGGTNPFPASGGPTSVTFGSIPSWVKRITVMFNGVSTSSTSDVICQIGSGSTTITGYSASGSNLNTSSMTTSAYTTGFPLMKSEIAASVMGGIAILTNVTSNVWAMSGNISRGDGVMTVSAGSISLSGTLDRVVITTVSPGTDTFDAGSINILYEG